MADYSGGWYRIYDELDSNVRYHVPAIHLRVLPLSYFEPISPDVPYDDKLIEVNLWPTELTADVDVVLRGRSSEVLPRVAQRLGVALLDLPGVVG